MSTCQNCCIQSIRSDCTHNCAEMETHCGSFLICISPQKHVQWICISSGSRSDWEMEIPQDKINGSAWLFLTHSHLSELLLPHRIHSMHVNTVALMNVAIVSTWAYVHKDGREIFSVFFLFQNHRFCSLGSRFSKRHSLYPSLRFCPLICPPAPLAASTKC